MLTRRLFAADIGDEVALVQDAQRVMQKLGDKLPDEREINELAGSEDANLASAVLHQTLLRDPRHGAFIQAVDAAPETSVAVAEAPLIVIVPGMFYREYPEIGAGGKLMAGIAARFGIETVVAPTLSLGSVGENLEILHRYLGEVATRPFWLVSMSRGSAEVKWLLQRYPDAQYAKKLHGWMSICGIVAGTALHERIYANPVLGALHRGFARINGIDRRLGEELLRSNECWQLPTCAPDVQVVNVIAIPLSWHVTNSAIRRYRRLCPLGPTDGVVQLTDYLGEPGLIYPLWGVDHFMRSNRIAALFYRLLYFLLVAKGESDERHNTVSNGFRAVDSERNRTGSACG